MKNIFALFLVLTLGFSVECRKIKHRRFDRHHSIKKLSQYLSAHKSTTNPDDLTCDQAIDRIFYRPPHIGSIFYVVSSSWSIGNWADYDTCYYDAFDSQYVVATVEGLYIGKFPLNNGVKGKYTNGMVSMMGLCFPRQCSEGDIRYYTEDLISGYAKGSGFINVKVNYNMASKDDALQTEGKLRGLMLYGCIIGMAGSLVFLGTCIETIKVGDQIENVRLKQLAKFVSLQQYDSILL